MAMIASKCPDIRVTVVDRSQERMDAWQSKHLPGYEPGLADLVAGCLGRNLFFSTDFEKEISKASVVFISVDAATKSFGMGSGNAVDMSSWETAARAIAAVATSSKIVVEKSTVPVNTADAIERILYHSSEVDGVRFDVLSNPDFTSKGTAIQDLEKPDRVLIGGKTDAHGLRAMETLASIYERWVPTERVVKVNVWSAELSKLAANAMLAQRVSSINALSELCEATGADVDQIAACIGADSRIGPKFLQASVGFGGSSFQKDILSLVYICQRLGLAKAAAFWNSIIDVNDHQKKRFVMRLIKSMCHTVTGKKIAVLGFAFKKNTQDVCESAAIDTCRLLLEDGARLSIYDPQVNERDIYGALGVESRPPLTNVSNQHALPDDREIEVVSDAYAACDGSHAVVILTDWPEFAKLDFQRVHDAMQKPAFVFDGRLMVDLERMRDIGFVAYGVGKTPDTFL